MYVISYVGLSPLTSRGLCYGGWWRLLRGSIAACIEVCYSIPLDKLLMMFLNK